MKIGQKLKKIKFIIDDKTVLTEKDLTGKKVIIYFYPKDDTPGCTTEAIDFTSFKNKFEKLNVMILGISKDSIEKHSKFIKKHNLEIKLVSDEDGKICKMFGVWAKPKLLSEIWGSPLQHIWMFGITGITWYTAWGKTMASGWDLLNG